MRYTKSTAAEKESLKQDRNVNSWEVVEKKYQRKLKKQNRKGNVSWKKFRENKKA
ncbi:hypothetical protein [Bacillus cereus]|uniref:hypothetical protein n=1 Tax=Bacillus cereus TaxID=1396 RepID=UPI0018F48CD5|nr:hypothetical protein [Bacillus cereus]MBJ8024756.1 hypothetical protein [Bacillus cereus]MBJ8037211.1 hypothetical protein [Bacillus cereus]